MFTHTDAFYEDRATEVTRVHYTAHNFVK